MKKNYVLYSVAVVAIVLSFLLSWKCGRRFPAHELKAQSEVMSISPTIFFPMDAELMELRAKNVRLVSENERLEGKCKVQEAVLKEVQARLYISEAGGTEKVLRDLNEELRFVEEKGTKGTLSEYWSGYFIPMVDKLKLADADPEMVNRILDKAEILGKKGKFFPMERMTEFYQDIERLRPKKTK